MDIGVSSRDCDQEKLCVVQDYETLPSQQVSCFNAPFLEVWGGGTRPGALRAWKRSRPATSGSELFPYARASQITRRSDALRRLPIVKQARYRQASWSNIDMNGTR